MKLNRLSKSNFELAIEKIKHDDVDVAAILDNAKQNENLDDLIKLVRLGLVDEKRENERSIYCGIIRELNDRDSLPLLWDLLLRDNTKGRRGSLLFAMENMNPIEYLEQLVELAINDNYEVMCNSLDIIDSLEGHVESDIIEKCIVKLQRALKGELPNWKKEALAILLSELLSD